MDGSFTRRRVWVTLQASAAVSATHHLSRNISKDIWDDLHTSNDPLQTGVHMSLQVVGVIRMSLPGKLCMGG